MRKVLGVFVLLLCILSTCWAQTRLEDLEQKILLQQQQIEKLETQIEQKELKNREKISTETTTRQSLPGQDSYVQVVEEYLNQPDAEGTTGPLSGYDHGFFLSSGDGNIVLKLKGDIMWQANITEAHTVTNNTIILRRNRLDTHAYFYNDWHARVRIGIDQNVNGVWQARIREAYMEYLGLSFLKLRVGVTKVPFSMEFFGDRSDQLAIAYSPFITMNSMPRRDAGLMIYGDGLPFLLGDFFSDHFGYSVGMYNGDAGTQDNDGAIGTNADDDFMFVACGRFFPFNQHEEENQNIFLHLALYVNDTDFREDGAGIVLDGLQNQEVYGGDLPGGGAAEDVDDTNGRQLGVDVGFRYWAGGLRIESEFMYMQMERALDRQNTPAGITAEREPLEMIGFSSAISYFFELMQEDMGIEPLFKFSFTTMEDRDKDDNSRVLNPPLGTVMDIGGQDIWEIVFGVRFHFNSYLRFDFNYIMYDLEETQGFSNNDRGSGGGMMHSGMFQVMARW